MDKRPKEIEEAMSIIDSCTFNSSNSDVEAWDTVYEYIMQLESTIQDMISEQERFEDDLK